MSYVIHVAMLKAFLVLVFSVLCFQSLAFAQTEDFKGYNVLSYEGTIELNREDTTLRGHATMRAVSMMDAPLGKVLQHLLYLEIDSAKIEGQSATIEPVDTASGTYYLIPHESVMLASEFTVETWYHGKPIPEQNQGKWGGVSNRGGMFFAMGVGFQAPYISCTRHWLPCYDLPDDKADSAKFIFVSPTTDIVVASGRLERTFDTLGGKGYEWNIIHPISTYLMTFAQGPFKEMSIENPIVQFSAFAQANDSARTHRLMERRVVRGLEYFDSLFAPYPFEKVGYVVAPIGSMEHQTMITLDRRTLDTNNTTAIHELAHMWWGDMVTCHTFNDPWLNEGFATYSESLYLERFEGPQAYRKRQWSKIQSAIKDGSSYPMYGAPYHTNHANNYPSAVIYDKGAAVIGMLRYFIGEQAFFTGLASYLNKYKYSTATSYELWNHFEAEAKQDLDWFFQKWVFERSYPTFDIKWNPGTTTKLRLDQSSDSGYFRLPIVVEATSASAEKVRRTVWTDSAATTLADLDFGFAPVSLQFDPDSVLIAKFNVELASVEPDGTRNRVLHLVPNPSTGENVMLTGLTDLDFGAFWTLVDSGGRVVTGGVINKTPVSIRLEDMAPGSYRLVLEQGGKIVATQQLIHEP